MSFERGSLRYITVGGRELVRRIYVAVRDRDWGTAPNVLSDVTPQVGDGHFCITFDCRSRLGDVDFEWHAVFAGATDGTLTLSMDGVARSTFLKNRIGFCVLHPAACAGAVCSVEHIGGARSAARLPRRIIADQPVRPFENMRALRQRFGPDAWLDIRFEGDVFEMEDQRNWTDASFKTFSTPLRLPYPVQVRQGQRVAQRLTLTLVGDGWRAPRRRASPAPRQAVITLGEQETDLPAIGLGIAPGPLPRGSTLERLRALALSHIRADLDLTTAAVEADLRRAARLSEALGTPLELAVLIPLDGAERALRDLAEAARAVKPRVRRWLIYRAQEKQADAPPLDWLVGLAWDALGPVTRRAEFVGGVNTDFIFINRHPAAARPLAALAVAISPQVHAFDDASLIETLSAQGTLVENARRLVRGGAVVISPITLKPRNNPYAAAGTPKTPPPSDDRQRTWFGAVWALGSIKYLAEAGAVSATYFETHGPRGLMDSRSAYPMFSVFAGLGPFARGRVVQSRSDRPLDVESLVLRKGQTMRALLANHTDETRLVILRGLHREAHVSDLIDEARLREIALSDSDRVRLELPARALMRVDWRLG